MKSKLLAALFLLFLTTFVVGLGNVTFTPVTATISNMKLFDTQYYDFIYNVSVDVNNSDNLTIANNDTTRCTSNVTTVTAPVNGTQDTFRVTCRLFTGELGVNWVVNLAGTTENSTNNGSTLLTLTPTDMSLTGAKVLTIIEEQGEPVLGGDAVTTPVIEAPKSNIFIIIGVFVLAALVFLGIIWVITRED